MVWDRNTGEPVYNAIVWQDTRTAGHRRLRSADGGQDRFRDKTGLPLATYFSGTKVSWILDNVDGARARGRGRRPGVRQHRHLVHLEPHRRDRRRRARHRRHQRQPHDADGPRDPRLGRRPAARRSGVPRSMLPADPVVVARCTARRRARWPASRSPATSATSRPPRSARPASTRRGEEHLRHRLLHAPEHRHRAGAVEERPAHDRRATSSATQPAVYALEGSIAITGALVQWLRDNLGMIEHVRGGRGAREHGRGQRRRRTSCRRSRACSRRTGEATPAARSSA